MSPLRIAYLALALIGALWPMPLWLGWGAEHGADPAALLAGWTANPAAAAMARMMMVIAAAFTLWVCAEVSVRRNWPALAVLPVSVVLGLGCGLPLYLFLRTRPVT